MDMPPIKLQIKRAWATNTFLPANHAVLRVYVQLCAEVPVKQITYVEGLLVLEANRFEADLKNAGFQEVSVGSVFVSASFQHLKMEVTLQVRCQGEGQWRDISEEEDKKIQAMMYVSNKKADKGKGPGVIEVEVPVFRGK